MIGTGRPDLRSGKSHCGGKRLHLAPVRLYENQAPSHQYSTTLMSLNEMYTVFAVMIFFISLFRVPFPPFLSMFLKRLIVKCRAVYSLYFYDLLLSSSPFPGEKSSPFWVLWGGNVAVGSFVWKKNRFHSRGRRIFTSCVGSNLEDHELCFQTEEAQLGSTVAWLPTTTQQQTPQTPTSARSGRFIHSFIHPSTIQLLNHYFICLISSSEDIQN